jgi:hypothetical protein
MKQFTVKEILHMIDTLSKRDREHLDRVLAARADAEWKRLAKEARAKARCRGIDQAATDRTVEQARHGER